MRKNTKRLCRILPKFFLDGLKTSDALANAADMFLMKTKNCVVCTGLGKKSFGNCPDEIYRTVGAPITIHLCYLHSVELFKLGQTSFVAKFHLDFIERDYGATNKAGNLNNYFAFNSFR
jgi:hypothetical protein